MAQFSDILQRKMSFFHSLSKTLTEESQYPFETKYKSGHTVLDKEIWIDSVDYCYDQTDADYFVLTRPTIAKKYTLFSLTEVPGSNGQSWYIEDGGQFIRPWISPSDVSDSVTNEPSYGFQANLYKSTNVLVTPTEGAWIVDYYSGIVRFESGYTPSDLGYGIPKITCYVYIGRKLSDIITSTGSLSSTGVAITSTGFEEENFTITSSGIVNLVLSHIPEKDSEFVFWNGVFLHKNQDYILSGNTIFVNVSIPGRIGNNFFVRYTRKIILGYLSNVHNNLQGLQGGSSTERYHVTSSQSAYISSIEIREVRGSTTTSTGTTTLDTVPLSLGHVSKWVMSYTDGTYYKGEEVISVEQGGVVTYNPYAVVGYPFDVVLNPISDTTNVYLFATNNESFPITISFKRVVV